ncbi:MAG: hypothetical protein S4CHLAM123_14770 [Chlamydiales bacterium]|nr:hypothetical protein [Chlamydiales bacterium]
MLLTMMYHRIGVGKYSNSLEMLRAHLLYLKERYPIVLPGDPLAKFKLSICLTFDDATFDFYHYIFPLLQEFNIRALLGVPVHYILDDTTLDPEERLSVPHSLMMQNDFFDKKAPFCTWKELEEMVHSGLVEVASHSYLHSNLTFDFVDRELEIVQSKRVLEKNLSQPISSFIYPFGRTTVALHEYVAQHYPYAFRIGSAFNWNWGKGNKPLNRVSGDNLTSPKEPVTLVPSLITLAKTLVI